MFSLWIPITIAAAFLQNLRSALQKSIKGRLSNSGAAYVRFFYAWPFALLYTWSLTAIGGYQLPTSSATFLVYCALGGLTQILFTVVLMWMFSFRSFAVGTTFSKLEVVLIAIMGAVLLGDTVGMLATVAIALGAAGTILLSLQETKMTLPGLLRGMGEKVTLVGLLCAALLGASVVFFRGAALTLQDNNFIIVASYTLSVSLIMQTVMMGAWFVVFDRPQLRKVVGEWRRALPIGLVGMACSVCWFTAFTLQNAAYVRALGQVELLFTIGASVFVFKERVSQNQIVAIVFIVCAILLILLSN
jgi:drug/metabolite transporter (DMT)-like permease